MFMSTRKGGSREEEDEEGTRIRRGSKLRRGCMKDRNKVRRP